MITNTIKVDQKFIKRAGLLFNATLKDILSELLQNSRRAGATRIDIEFTEDIKGNVKDNVITIKDNGVGFFSESTDINLGGTKWNEATQVKEDPAGCGIFSLAHCEYVHVRANNFVLTLSPEHFTGSIPYTILESATAAGTSITFKHNKELTAEEALRLCISATEYLPKEIDVYINKVLVHKRDIFEGIESQHIFQWEGLEIGLELGRSKWTCVPYINFFGLLVRIKNHKSLYVNYLPDGTHPAICSVSFSINIVDCPHLDLVLPRRKESVKNDFYYRLIAKLDSLAKDYLKTLPDIISCNFDADFKFTDRLPVINLDDNDVYDRSVIHSDIAVKYREVNDDTIYLVEGISKSNAVLICHALEKSGYDLGNVVLVPEDSRLPYVVEEDIEVDFDNYKVILYCHKKTIKLETNILWTPVDEYETIEEANIAVNKAKADSNDVRALLTSAFFTFHEDGDCYESQEWDFHKILDDLMPRLISSSKEEEIETLIAANCKHLIPKGYSVSIVKTIDGDFTVKATNNNPLIN